MTRYFFLFESYCPVHVGRPVWREDGSVVCQRMYVQYIQGLCQSRGICLLQTVVLILTAVRTSDMQPRSPFFGSVPWLVCVHRNEYAYCCVEVFFRLWTNTEVLQRRDGAKRTTSSRIQEMEKNSSGKIWLAPFFLISVCISCPSSSRLASLNHFNFDLSLSKQNTFPLNPLWVFLFAYR
jgi:hypothetical protein